MRVIVNDFPEVASCRFGKPHPSGGFEGDEAAYFADHLLGVEDGASGLRTLSKSPEAVSYEPCGIGADLGPAAEPFGDHEDQRRDPDRSGIEPANGDALLQDAAHLFYAAVREGWYVDGAPGFIYAVDWRGAPRVRQRLHWVLCEELGAATALWEVSSEALPRLVCDPEGLCRRVPDRPRAGLLAPRARRRQPACSDDPSRQGGYLPRIAGDPPTPPGPRSWARLRTARPCAEHLTVRTALIV